MENYELIMKNNMDDGGTPKGMDLTIGEHKGI